MATPQHGPDPRLRIAVLTGAGISAPSGLPTYRGDNGLWDTDPKLARLVTASRWQQDPGRAWAHWNAIRKAAHTARPNAAHEALADARHHADIHIATQNVDALHQQAGSTGVSELHGNVFRTRCSDDSCHKQHGPWDDRELHPQTPECPRCGRIARLDVVLFEEQLPQRPYLDSVRAVQQADVWIAVGTSGTVFPAASLGDHAPAGTPKILVNKTTWTDEYTRFEREILDDAATTLPVLLQALIAGNL